MGQPAGAPSGPGPGGGSAGLLGRRRFRTFLIQARAAVHTTKLTEVGAKTDAAVAKAAEAEKFAQARLDESLFRRQAMIVVLALIMVTIVALFLLRRGLDHSYEHE